MNSKKSLDLRVRRTHKLLWDALVDLIKEYEFDSIRVQQICDQAMVHRTTFYKHYEDKYDLLRRGILTLFDGLVTSLPTTTIAAQEAVHRTPAHFVSIFRHAAEHQALYKVLLANGGVAPFRKLLHTYLTQQIANRLHQMPPQKQRVIPEPVIVQFNVGALLMVLTWWIECDLPYSAEQVATWVHELIVAGTFPAFGLLLKG